MLRKRKVRERRKEAQKEYKKGREENPYRHRRQTTDMFHQQQAEWNEARIPGMQNTFLVHEERCARWAAVVVIGEGRVASVLGEYS